MCKRGQVRAQLLANRSYYSLFRRLYRRESYSQLHHTDLFEALTNLKWNEESEESFSSALLDAPDTPSSLSRFFASNLERDRHTMVSEPSPQIELEPRNHHVLRLESPRRLLRHLTETEKRQPWLKILAICCCSILILVLEVFKVCEHRK